jgi:hypothetical protein
MNTHYRAVTAVVLLAALALGACAPQPRRHRFQGGLPSVPADIQTCFRAGPGKVPQKALSVAEVESLWKQDRVHEVVLQRCGKRFLAWYGDLRKGGR